MEIDEIAEYTTINLLVNRNFKDFAKSQEYFVSPSIVFGLLRIHYLINTKGSCWTKDLLDGISENRINRKRNLDLSLHFHMKANVIERKERDKILGYRWEITNKGMFILQQYSMFIKEELKKYHYKIKKSHKESRELKEK